MHKTQRSDETRTAISAALNSVASLIAFAFSALFVPITSRILSAADLGKAVSFLTTREIVFVVITLSITQSTSLAMIHFKEQKKEFMSSIFLFESFCLLVMLIIASFFKSQLLPLFFGSSLLFYWFFFMLMCQLAMEIITFYLTFHNRFVLVSLTVMGTYILPLLAATGMVMAMDSEKYLGRIVGMDTFTMAAGIIGAGAILIGGRLKLSMVHVKYALRLTIPLVPYMLSSMVLVRSDIVVISYMDGDTAAGIYTMSFTIANILFAALQQVMRSWSPWVYRKLSENDTELVRKNSRHLIVLVFLAGLLLMYVAPEFVGWFFDKSYYDCVYLVGPIVVGMHFRVLGQFYYDVQYFHKRNNFIAVASIVTAVVNLLLNITLIGRFGYIICAITTAMCYGLLAIAHFLYTRTIEPRKMYDTPRIFAYSAAVVALGSLAPLLTGSAALRYGVLAAALVITAVVERDYFSTAKQLASHFFRKKGI